MCAIFRGERAQQPPKKVVWKHLNIYNLTATNAKLMKLIMSMYLHNKLNLAEDWGVIHRA